MFLFSTFSHLRLLLFRKEWGHASMSKCLPTAQSGQGQVAPYSVVVLFSEASLKLLDGKATDRLLSVVNRQ